MNTKNTNKKNQLIVNQYMTTEGKASGTILGFTFCKNGTIRRAKKSTISKK
jgi:hypothetical protein